MSLDVVKLERPKFEYGDRVVVTDQTNPHYYQIGYVAGFSDEPWDPVCGVVFVFFINEETHVEFPTWQVQEY